jgi:RND superfamily putative drug exporter
MLERLAQWCYTRRWRVLIAWIIALVGFGYLANVAGGQYATSFSLPGTESQEVFDLLEQRFPTAAGDTATIVFRAEDGVESVQPQMEEFFDQVAQLPHVDGVVSPYAEQQGAAGVSQDGTIAFATVQFHGQSGEVPREEVDQLRDLAEATEGPGLQIELGGPVVEQSEFEPPGGAESVGLLAAVIILLLTFGSVLAMGLPIMTALFGIAIGMSLLFLSAHFISVPNFTPQLAAMIGIGVGIDYALFIVTRYRSALEDGADPRSAVIKSMTTAGRAVLFAGVVVVISFLGILLMGFDFIQGVAVGGAAAVFVTMLASLTLLPAVLGFVGRNIDKLHIPHLRRRERTGRESGWYRWSRLIQRRPVIFFGIGLVMLIALAIPLFSLRLGVADAGNNPESLSSRRAYDLLSQGFGPGFNGRLLLAAEVNSPADLEVLDRLSQTLAQTPGVAAVTPLVPSPEGNAAILTVFPTTAPQAEATDQLVDRLRSEVVPQATEGTDVEVLVGGFSAIFKDFSQQAAERLPILMIVVIGLSFLLLMAVFRSVLVPLKAAVMNVLSIGAAYGVVVAIFQWGWLREVFGVGKPGPIEAWLPMMLFTILFGLSMDYEIFLLSRIREFYLQSHDNATSVANGVAATGRVITAAAAIMVAVFLSFVIGFDIRQIKLFGLGLAVAVLIDATLVRMVLVPATMELLGDANWWFPKWLDRAVPRLAVEAPPEAREEPLERVPG